VVVNPIVSCGQRVDISDLSSARLAAQRLGARASGRGLASEYDVVFDAVGSAATRGLRRPPAPRRGGHPWPMRRQASTANALARSEKRILGSFAYIDGEFAAAMALVREWDLTWAANYPLASGRRSSPR
jgi:hypothetical protein